MEPLEEAATTSPPTERAPSNGQSLDGGSDSLILRPMRDLDDYRACEELQRAVWGQAFSEVVPASILRVSAEVGGVVAGAFESGERMVGFVFGLTGLQEGRLIHWSHMLGVRRSHRGMGLGYRLKQFQRGFLMDHGIPEMRWTFDPLVAANAHFNLTRLAARVVAYVPDMYGDTGSRHHAFGTDRFLVTWPLTEPLTPAPSRESITSHPKTQGESSRVWAQAPVINPAPSRDSVRPDPGPYEEPCLRIAIPRDVVGLSRRSAEEARKWRDSTRQAFLGALAAGYTIVGFQRPQDRNAFGHYRLRRDQD